MSKQTECIEWLLFWFRSYISKNRRRSFKVVCIFVAGFICLKPFFLLFYRRKKNMLNNKFKFQRIKREERERE